MNEAIPAVILAGGQAKPEFVQATGLTNRALIPVNGKTMLACVVDALRSSHGIGAIRVVGNLAESNDYESIADHGGFVENLFAGIAGLESHRFVLVATADLPFLTAESVEDLVKRGRDIQADMVYPAVDVSECYARFPGVHRTTVKMREGEFTGGNLVLVSPQFLAANRERVSASYAMRKKPVKFAMMMGPGILIRFALARYCCPSVLSIRHLEQAGSRVVGGTVHAVVSPYPEIATDIDRPDDLAILTKVTPA